MQIHFNRSEKKPLEYPRELCIVGGRKIGKSTVGADLSRNLPDANACAILSLDVPDGYVYTEEGYIKLEPKNVFEIQKLYKQALRIMQTKGRRPYKFLYVDTVTSLETMCWQLATQQYMATPAGQSFNRVSKKRIKDDPDVAAAVARGELVEGQTIPEDSQYYLQVDVLEYGGGYAYLRNAFRTVLGWLRHLAERIIYVAHIRDSQLQKDSVLKAAKAMDLTGKVASILATEVDALCFASRTGRKLVLDFATNDIESGSRYTALDGQKVVLSEKEKKSDDVNCFWENIYTDLPDLQGKKKAVIAENDTSQNDNK